jgi:hypothetical protein
MHDRVIGDWGSALTRRVRGALFVLLTGIVATVAAAAPLSSTARAEIEGLMSRLETSGCEFNRNGTWYTATEAASHLQRKAKYLEDRGMVESADQFIERAASGSSVTGQPYLVKCGGGSPVTSGEWLLLQLQGMRSGGRPSDQP